MKGWLWVTVLGLGLAACSEATVQAALALGTDVAAHGLTFHLTSQPAQPVEGENTFHLWVGDAQGQPITDAEVWFTYDMTNMSHGKAIVSATPTGPGNYSGQVDFMMPGPWRLTAVVQRPGQPSYDVTFDFDVAAP